jgi:hypothetical protein
VGPFREERFILRVRASEWRSGSPSQAYLVQKFGETQTTFWAHDRFVAPESQKRQLPVLARSQFSLFPVADPERAALATEPRLACPDRGYRRRRIPGIDASQTIHHPLTLGEVKLPSLLDLRPILFDGCATKRRLGRSEHNDLRAPRNDCRTCDEKPVLRQNVVRLSDSLGSIRDPRPRR